VAFNAIGALVMTEPFRLHTGLNIAQIFAKILSSRPETKRVKMEEIYGYARVSTQEQALNTHALEQQIERLKQAGCTDIYVDIVSGSKSERPQFSALMALVRQGKVKKIRAIRWDRLTRNEELYLELKKVFRLLVCN
jgi:predicted site-specific integrase-resolvase